MKQKLSRWNSYIPLGGSSGLIYNALSDSFICTKRGSEDFQRAVCGDIAHFSENFADKMKDGGALVPEEKDEVAELSSLIATIDNDDSFLHLIINPTLDCNFNCWYCYEKHERGSAMSREIMDAVIALVRKRINDNSNLKTVFLSFFGGEPLLRFKDTVKPLITEVDAVCNKYNLKFDVNFTSNSYLLDDTAIDFLSPYSPSFQITLDGGRESHDNTRFGKGKTPSFDVIVGNILKLARAGMRVTARINYTARNIDSTEEIIDILSSLSSEYRCNITVDYQKVWQDESGLFNDATYDKVRSFRKRLREMGYGAANNKIVDSVRFSCYADKRNELLINFNGDVFACTARDFNTDNRLGRISEDGTVLSEKNRIEERMACRFTKAICRECKIAPICGGGCRTKCLENREHDGCNIGMTPEKIDDLILERFEERYLKI